MFGDGSPHDVGAHLSALVLEGLKHESPSHPRGIGFNEGVEAAIAALQSAAAPQTEPEECVMDIKQQSKGDAMNFGEAQELMKTGSNICRAGWNGKGMYVFYITNWRFNQAGDAERLPFTALKTADNKIVPWTVSQTDAHATDWEVAV